MADDKESPSRPSNDTLHEEPATTTIISASPPPPSHHRGPSLQTIIDQAIEVTNPPLRHLASHSSLGSINSHGTRGSVSDIRSARTRLSFRPLSTNFEEQRHIGKPNLSITRNTREYDPDTPLQGKISTLRNVNHSRDHSFVSSSVNGAGFMSDDATLFSDPTNSVIASTINEESLDSLKKKEALEIEEPDRAPPAAQESNAEEDDNVHPGPLGLSLLIIGIALSVFLISVDRTIITTAIPFITNEFESYADIGWYGSAYLLTASAFQPLYGRIFMLFDIKWSYLLALSMFELGSLICGVAPNSVALIVGRAIAGLGSAGLLTGSFVVVSHAVTLAKRPLMTAVVGLMFGVGATAGPLLGGVFTDLVTWRWCFYFNLPVGGATFAAMVLFFKPPKKHALAGKSFFYRIFELDLVGNTIILGAAVMLFLALQLTEQHTPWGSAEVIGLLTGAGCTFIIFCVWMWWKADGALIPPRIIGQRSVAASCAVAFFLYSSTLVHMFYLPFWFQAIRGDSAIHSGVNMIPYVVANAAFSLLAGIFVSKNGYFTAPAIVGCVIGTVGCGLLSTLKVDISSSMWIGYEILASAGIGMAIQQGFTAVQIVLPLDEVAIGTAAVVAFQSLGGAVFVSVGNNILQNTLISASRNNEIPGVDIQAVIDAGAAAFRGIVRDEDLPALLVVYNNALQKVFTAAIPVAGLAVISCLFLEWRNVKDQRKSDEEMARKEKEKRSETERAILEAYRKRASGGSNSTWGHTSRNASMF